MTQTHSHLSTACDQRRTPTDKNIFDKSKSHQQVYDETIIAVRHLRALSGCLVIVRWSCENSALMKIDAQYAQFRKQMRHIDWNMDIRRALYGGK
jgi:hypothetical protein